MSRSPLLRGVVFTVLMGSGAACGIAGEEFFGEVPEGGAGGAGGSASTTTATTATGSTTTGTTATTGTSSTTTTTTGATTTTTTTVATTTTTTGGGVDPIGCSDGTREYFSDVNGQPNIAGCAGGFSVAGVTTAASMAPACDRVSGNDSANAQGTGCSIEDLCSVGWHVCHGSIDVGASSADGQCEITAQQTFWLTRQVQDDNGNCATPPNRNNVTGCGNLGDPPIGVNCSPLVTRMRQYDCAPTDAWFCGADPNADGLKEAELVVKVGPAEGGVLCCKD